MANNVDENDVVTFTFRIMPEQLNRYSFFADQANVSLGHFIREACDEFCDQIRDIKRQERIEAEQSEEPDQSPHQTADYH